MHTVSILAIRTQAPIRHTYMMYESYVHRYDRTAPSLPAPHNVAMSTDLTTVPPSGKKSVLFFWANWHAESSPRGNIDIVFQTLAKQSGEDVAYYRVEAEAVPDLSLKYGVTVVPTFLLLDSTGTVVDRVDGADDIPRLTQAVSALSSRGAPETSAELASAPAVSQADALNARLESLINAYQVMLFMKGTVESPNCGFSRQAVKLLSDAKVSFGTFDILSDDTVRQGLKTFSDWPTYPQLYVNGDLIGGLDIMNEMAEEGDLSEQLGVPKSDVAVLSEGEEKSSLDDRMKKLINRNRVMLFMKGLPSAPKCGFSRQIVKLLDDEGSSYDSFNILEDEEIRQGLKTYSDWPTYPQLYVDGDLVGGLDIVKEMKESGDLSDLLSG